MGWDQDALHILDGVTQLALVAHTHWVTLTPFHRGGHVPAPEGDFDHRLHLGDGHSIASRSFAVHVNQQVGLADHAICKGGLGFDLWNLLEVFF